MGKGNVCVFGKYEGLYYIDNDDLACYRRKDYQQTGDDEHTVRRNIPFEELEEWEYDDVSSEWWFDEVMEQLEEDIKSRFKSFARCDKWLTNTQHAFLQNGLFYICTEDNEWSVAIELIQKKDEFAGERKENLQRQHFKNYLKGIRNALFNQFEEIGAYGGAWTHMTLKRKVEDGSNG